MQEVSYHTKAIIGVDPGSPLYMALLSPAGKWVAHAGDDAVTVETMGKTGNCPKKLAEIAKKWVDEFGGNKRVEVCMEKVHPMPGEGVLSVAKFVGSMWLMRGIFAALEVPVTLVAPRTWKSVSNLSSAKGMSLARARNLFPDRAWRLKLAQDHNYAEAALLAHYLRNQRIIAMKERGKVTKKKF